MNKACKSLLFLWISLLSITFTQAQTIKFKVTGKPATERKVHFSFPGLTFGNEKPTEQSLSQLDGFEYKSTSQSPQIILVHLSKWHTFYLSPQDNLLVNVDFSSPEEKITVSGKGKENNAASLDYFIDTEEFMGDTLPERVYQFIQTTVAQRHDLLRKYAQQNHPTEDFIKNWNLQIDYSGTLEFLSFLENNKYVIQKAFLHNQKSWYDAFEQLLQKTPLQNDQAIHIPAYRELISQFTMRKKGKLWEQLWADKDGFFKEWFGLTSAQGEALLKDDTENLIQLKIIQRYFKNASLEYAYAYILNNSLQESSIDNLDKVYAAFIQQFPKSAYRRSLDSRVAEKISQYQQPLNSKMVFVDSTASFTSFDQVLEKVKGKTVLLDMWGTWCGPCREELEMHSAALKEHFKDRDDVVFLYIANRDLDTRNTWKKLIGYYNLTGHHILASKSLNADIMTKVKGQGYPSYVIIDKKGNYKLSKSPYPLNRELLIKEIEDKL
ncbi:MAG: TlpA disulfide reductase family protein [Bacteroidota bacterium]